MRELKMAELKFEAPLATFENEDWNDFNDYQTASDDNNSSKPTNNLRSGGKTDNSSVENFGEHFSGSLEDLVNTLDDKITKCFCNYEDKVEQFAPVQIRTQEEIMSDCQMWWTITGNFGNLLPIDWSKSYVRELHTKALNLPEKQEYVEENLDLSDDEDLAQAFDMHSLIVSSIQSDTDPVISADQVINEIECMMRDAPPEETCIDDIVPELPPPYTTIKESLSHLPTCSETELKNMSVGALNDILTEYERTTKGLSETLVQELALRDDLEFDKELKNQFISLLLTIQKKRRENNIDRKKNKKNKLNNNNSPGEGPASGTYLTTVIPYHPQLGAPTSEQLQIYIKILEAINEDSATVPTLLTDYILKVLCPT